MNTDLEAKAAAALERARENAPTLSPDTAQRVDVPTIPTDKGPIEYVESEVSSIQEQHTGEDYEEVAPPPTAEEMAAKTGAITSYDVSKPSPREEEEAVVISGSNVTTQPLTEEDETIILTSLAKERLGNVPEGDRDSFISGIMPEIASYKKSLILEAGMTPAEATKAAESRMKRSANEFAENWAKEHPEGVILTIDKSQESELNLDEETMQKVQRAKAIKLVTVEAQELKDLKIKPFDKSTIKMSHIRNICDSISRYSVPLLSRGDYAYFNGAQSGVLVNATTGDDDDMLDALEKKASLLYRCFSSSITKAKRDAAGKEMTYEEFCNWFKYDDVDMGIYAIVTASTMEESESTYICQNRQCNKTFNIKYNNKLLLDLSELPEPFKERLKEIDGHRSSLEYMTGLSDKCDMHERLQSPFSKTIFELGNPSIAEVRHKLDKCMNLIDETTAPDLVSFIYINTIWIYDPDDDTYMPIDTNENAEEAFDILCHLHQVDLEIVMKALQDRQYSPAFKIHVKCPHCGRDAVDRLGIDAMIFLHARASLTEIQ